MNDGPAATSCPDFRFLARVPAIQRDGLRREDTLDIVGTLAARLKPVHNPGGELGELPLILQPLAVLRPGSSVQRMNIGNRQPSGYSSAS